MPNSASPKLLYATASGIGATGLDLVAAETLVGAIHSGVLGNAIAYSLDDPRIPSNRVTLLNRHPVKLLSALPKDYYWGAKKQALSHAASHALKSGKFDLFHTWSGDCLEALRTANAMRIPSILEIPTWHRNKGKVKKDVTWSEIQRDSARFPQSVLNKLLITRQRVMEEYERADLIIVLSQKAKETFLVAGIPEAKLFLGTRGVDPKQFQPGSPPDVFRAIFVGSLIRRKGVHHLLDVWTELNLPNSELVLVGNPSPELAPKIAAAPKNVILRGHVRDVASELRRASVHVFPSECEGCAKATIEAAACGLPQISTREAGDVVLDGITGLVIPPNDPVALATAIRTLHDHPERARTMGLAARQRVEAHFTWDHFRLRVRSAYQTAREIASMNPTQLPS